jgi:hypothetical protein
MTFLLDVNLLFVLHQPLHPDYKHVDRWFRSGVGKAFATCPITETGMVRLLLRGIAGLDPFDMQEAREALLQFTQRPNHVYWPDDPSYHDATMALFARMQGHRQTTDAYLLGLAINRKGKLATLDRGIAHLAGREFAAHVEIIEI